VRTALLPDCRPLLADPDDLTLMFQPIVDLTDATVSGYRALARFPGTAGPDIWRTPVSAPNSRRSHCTRRSGLSTPCRPTRS
jgi:hypothetical protein